VALSWRPSSPRPRLEAGESLLPGGTSDVDGAEASQLIPQRHGGQMHPTLLTRLASDGSLSVCS